MKSTGGALCDPRIRADLHPCVHTLWSTCTQRKIACVVIFSACRGGLLEVSQGTPCGGADPPAGAPARPGAGAEKSTGRGQEKTRLLGPAVEEELLHVEVAGLEAGP